MCFTSLHFLNVSNLQTNNISWIKSTHEFANKDSIIRKTSWKFPVHYVITTFHFWWEFSFRKGKVSFYWIIIFLCRVKKMKFYCFTVAFLFLKDKKLKKLAVALKFLYFFTVSCLNSNVFASKDPFP